MHSKKPDVFTFKKIEGEWQMMISGKFAYYMFSTLGFPPEMTSEEINTMLKRLSIEERLNLKLEHWERFAKEEGIDLDEVRESNKEGKEEFVAMLEELK